jgi:hypothetical protein
MIKPSPRSQGVTEAISFGWADGKGGSRHNSHYYAVPVGFHGFPIGNAFLLSYV